MRRRSPLARPLVRVVAWGALLTILAAASAGGSTDAAAQARPDREAPSQRLASDPDRSVWDVTLTLDALGPLFGRYGAQLEVAPVRWGSLAIGAAWRAGGASGDANLSVGARLWPLAEGLEGPFLGPTLVAAGRASTLTWGAEVEVGWQFVWDGWVVAAGARCGWHTGLPGGAQAVEFGARLAIGRGWR
jgi:hypothetical protein